MRVCVSVHACCACVYVCVCLSVRVRECACTFKGRAVPGHRDRPPCSPLQAQVAAHPQHFPLVPGSAPRPTRRSRLPSFSSRTWSLRACVGARAPGHVPAAPRLFNSTTWTENSFSPAVRRRDIHYLRIRKCSYSLAYKGLMNDLLLDGKAY